MNKKQLTIPQRVLCFMIQKQIEKELSVLCNDLLFQPKVEEGKILYFEFNVDKSTPIKSIHTSFELTN